MEKQDIYPQVMYGTLGCMTKVLHRDSKNPLENTSAALIMTNHQNLIDQILSNKNLREEKFCEILNAYLELGNFEEIIKLLNNYKEDLNYFNFKNFVKKLIQGNSEELILSYCDYINTLDTKLIYFRDLLQNLWEKNNFSFAEQIIKTYLPLESQNIFFVIHNLQKGIFPDSNGVSSAVEQFCNIPIKDGGKNWEHKQSLEKIVKFLIQELDRNNIDIPTLKEAIMSYEKQKYNKKIGFISDIYEVYGKIREYYYKNADFKEVESFINATGDGVGYDFGYNYELIMKKTSHAIKTKDKELHQKSLELLITRNDEQIQELIIASENKKEAFYWSSRCSLYEKKATKFAHQAIFEILHGTKEKAQEYINLMIENTENIMTSIPKGISKRNKGHIKGKIKRPFKLGLKELFLENGLFDYLPEKYGWNHPIKDPEIRKADRKLFEEQKELKNKRNKNDEKIDKMTETRKTLTLKKLLDEKKLEEAIEFLEKSSYGTYKGDWERGMLILDYSNASFHKIFDILGKDCFGKRGNRDRGDYDAMAQFFIKGHSMGILDDSDWRNLVRNLQNSMYSAEYGRSIIPIDGIISIIKYTTSVGDIDRAWWFFEKFRNILSNENGASNDSTISTCLSYFIKATTNKEIRNGEHLAFKGVDIRREKNISKIDRIKYWNTTTNINVKNDEKYKSNIVLLQKNILNFPNQTETIRLWCRDLVKNCLRNPEQIKHELEFFLQSDLGKIENVRRRVIYTMIELGVPGMESMEDVTRKNQPLEVQYLYLKKLVQKKYLTEDTQMFLKKINWKKHIPYLIKLLVNYQSQFNLVIDNICENDRRIIRDIVYCGTSEEKKKLGKKLFKVGDWRKIFKVLDAFSKYEVNYNLIVYNLNSITKHPKGLYFGYFSECLKNDIKVEESDISKFPITQDNFLDLMKENDILITFEKDAPFKPEGIRPWSKAWFLEKPERKDYLKPENIKTFTKFGTIIGLGILEGSQDTPHLKGFYEYIFANISPTISRSSILQLGEVFNLLLKKEKYEMLDELVDREVNIGKDFKKFIEENKISDKGRTIVTLMIAREINQSFQIFKDSSGNNQIDNVNIKEMLLGVYQKFKRYNEVINTYKNVPIKTSIGIEYEVTKSIADGYKELTGSDYKNDIEILSEYSGISRGNDAVHEIATKPTDNPYLLLLELKLLEDLDFLDLNFKKEDYKRGARGLHISLGGEYGISLDPNTYFIQNILVAGNLGGLNVGDAIERGGNIRDRQSDCEAIFGEDETSCVEYRGLSIDKSEPFERLILSIFNLNMAKQAVDEYNWGNISPRYLQITADKSSSFEEFEEVLKKDIKNEGPETDKKIYKLMYEFLKLQSDIISLIKEHNSNFVDNETFDLTKGSGLDKLLLLLTSTGPVIQIMEQVGVDIYYFKKLVEDGIVQEDEFFDRLEEDGKNINITERQKKILYLEYKLKIKPNLEKIRQENIKVYDDIGTYLNGNTDDTLRKITNGKRFKEVINGDEKYLENIKISLDEIFNSKNTELTNVFTNINNLFIKKDSTNALGMFDTTKEPDGTIISDSRLTETMIFDKLDRGLKPRKGYNVIQGASEKMLTQAIQAKILEFNENIVFGVQSKS